LNLTLATYVLQSNFTVKDVPVSFVPHVFTAFPYGKWRADFTLRKKGLAGCVRFYFDTVPRVDKTK